MKKNLLITFLLLLCIVAKAQEKKLTIAVLDPTTSGISMDEGTKIAVQELISSTFVNTGKYKVMERSMIDKIIKEQAFQNSDMADNSQASEIGKLAGANKVVLSAVSLVGGRNMLSIKIIDVTTASIDQQKTKIVNSNDLLDAVEPLTLELLGEEANYVKQQTHFVQVTEEQVPSKQNATSGKSESKEDAPKSSIDYSKKNNDVCQQVQKGIESIRSVSNPKLKNLLETGKRQSQITLNRGLKAEISAAGVLQIFGEGEMLSTDEKLLAPYKQFTTAVIIGEGVTKVCAFSSFSKVQYVSLPNTLQVIEGNCFNSCSNLLAVNIPSTVSRIGKNAFKNCENLIEVVLPNSIEYIGEGAFEGCKNLMSINIPDAVLSISESQFEGCESLRKIVIPEKVTMIGKNAFRNCSNIQVLYIPDNVLSIGESAFQRMKSLYEIRLSENVAVISKCAFENCSSLVKISCPAKVNIIGEKAFNGCNQLIQITFLSESINSFGKECFASCDNLGSIVIHSLKPPQAEKLFGDKEDVREHITLSVPTAGYAWYKKADFWSDFTTIVTF